MNLVLLTGQLSCHSKIMECSTAISASPFSDDPEPSSPIQEASYLPLVTSFSLTAFSFLLQLLFNPTYNSLFHQTLTWIKWMNEWMIKQAVFLKKNCSHEYKKNDDASYHCSCPRKRLPLQQWVSVLPFTLLPSWHYVFILLVTHLLPLSHLHSF